MTDATRPALRSGATHFCVTELDAYPACGSGEHLYVEIEKQNLTTDEVARALARACGRPLGAVGYAGRKDRRAIARQRFSVQLGDAASLEKLRVPEAGRLDVLGVSRHRNKLRTGHLTGNRFELGLSGVGGSGTAEKLRARLADLVEQGMLHRFGSQRFGVRGSTLALARAWGAGQLERAAAYLVDPSGRWRPGEALPRSIRPGPARAARACLERDACDVAGALAAVGSRFRRLVASAAQSAVFNAILEARVAAGLLHELREGDVAMGPGGRPFVCGAQDVSDLCQRAAPGVLEIRTTGPLPGPRCPKPADPIDAQERQWCADVGVDWRWFERGEPLHSAGARRPLIVRFLEPPELRLDGRHARLLFALPPGGYATEVLEQVGVALPPERRS